MRFVNKHTQTRYLFKARLVVVGILSHQRLDGDEDGRDALGRTPSWTSPRPREKLQNVINKNCKTQRAVKKTQGGGLFTEYNTKTQQLQSYNWTLTFQEQSNRPVTDNSTLTPGCWGTPCRCGKSWGWSARCSVLWWWAWPGEDGWGSRGGSGTKRGRSRPRTVCRTAPWSERGSEGREKSRQRTVMAGVSTYVYADDSNIYYTDQIFPWLSESLWGNKLKEWFILFC